VAGGKSEEEWEGVRGDRQLAGAVGVVLVVEALCVCMFVLGVVTLCSDGTVA